MEKLRDAMDSSQELNWEEASQREFMSGESSVNNAGLYPSGTCGISKDASNTICSQAEEEEKQLIASSADYMGSNRCLYGNPYDDKHEVAFWTQSTLRHITDDLETEDISLREWLNTPDRAVDKVECLHVFKQILEIVHLAHSEGVVLQNIRPSCFMLSSFNRVSFIESASCTSSGSELSEDSTERLAQALSDQTGRAPRQYGDDVGNISRVREEVEQSTSDQIAGHQTQQSTVYTLEPGTREGIAHAEIDAVNVDGNVQERSNCFPLKQLLLMELNWYTSPEELAGKSISFSSDIYCLGVLFFELFCTFNSEAEQQTIMSNLRHRVLPPQLLLKWPKEACFCQRLLHPVPASRPKLSEVLQSDIISEANDALEERQAAVKLKEKIADTELLLDFLLQAQQLKQERANKLSDAVTSLTSDIEEVVKHQSILQQKGNLYLEFNRSEQYSLDKGKKSIDSSSQLDQISETSLTNSTGIPTGKTTMLGKHLRQENKNNKEICGKKIGKCDFQVDREGELISRSERLMKNFKKLEQVYFSTRCKPKQFVGNSTGRHLGGSSIGWGSIVGAEGFNVSSVDSLTGTVQKGEGSMNDRLGSFFDSLCKYLRFSKFDVKANLNQGDLLNTSNLVCSLSFDRDKESFATAGVNKRIKVFECDTILNDNMDMHYPVTEMTGKSKFSNVCWNSHIKNQIASSDFEGVVRIWDAPRSQPIMDYKEHGKRVWSVDFSQSDPTKLASGSDDCTVKLWSINQVGSISTIRTKANVCCVQFQPDSGHLIALGSADYKIYCYDLRNIKTPWYILANHSKTVSYVKFLDSASLVSASTDNTLKLWDLATNKGRILKNPVRTFTGHTNVKNFVGLSVADGYIATGSETNEVFVYHKSLPMPVASYKFNCEDPMTGLEMEDDSAQFVSCVCWRGQTQTLVAANSTGNIKVLEMV